MYIYIYIYIYIHMYSVNFSVICLYYVNVLSIVWVGLHVLDLPIAKLIDNIYV